LSALLNNMGKILNKKDAIAYTGLDQKTFDNYFKNAQEFKCMKRNGPHGRFMFSEEVLAEWKKSYKWRTVNLTLSDYALCLDFALAQHFRGYVLSDWGTARQREFGQKITNWVKGQLGEVAVKKFFKKEFSIEVELDFNIYGNIVPQDIIGIIRNGKMQKPRKDVGIKSSKPKSSYLVLSESEINIPERHSDIYIYCRPDIPDDHLLRIAKQEIISIVKNMPHFSKYNVDMPDFSEITCEVSGWCWSNDLKEVTGIEGQEFDGKRFVEKSGLLKKSRKDWEELISIL